MIPEPAKFDPERTPSIKWNGRDYPVLEMPAYQLDVVWDDMKEVSLALAREEDKQSRELSSDEDDGETPTVMRGLKTVRMTYGLSGDEFAKMRRIVFYGLQTGHPDLDRKEFDSVATTPLDMLLAFLTVRTQSHMYDIRVSGPHTLGEAKAAKSVPTGITS